MAHLAKLILLPQWNLSLEFCVQPEISTPFSLSETVLTPDGQSRIYRAGDYLLTVTEGEFQGSTTIDFSLRREDGANFKTDRYAVECVIPVVDVYNVSPRFLGYAFTEHRNPDTFRSSCTSKDPPLVMYGDRSGENRFTIGLEKQYIETDVSRGRRETEGYMFYSKSFIRFERPVSGVTLHRNEIADGIFLSTERKDCFQTVKGYWDYIDARRNYRPNPSPISAYGPLWCSWLYLTDINEEIIWKNACKAKELGIKTLIIDAGWFADDRDIPFPYSPLTNQTFGFGRINASTSKFPDMKRLVSQIHELGLYVWAWCTPRWTFCAIEDGDGKVDQRLLDCRIVDKTGIQRPMLCTRHPNTREHAARFTSYLLREYGFDGLKFDCWELEDGMEVCYSSHEHDCDTMGEGTLQWGKAIYDAMIAVNPEAVVWLNNTVMKPFANYSCSPNEVYCQPDENWRLSPLVKTFATGILSHLSEGAWHPDEPVKSLARQLAILMMGHVPEVQVDLTALSQDHQRVVKGYLSFYTSHREELLFGEYTPFGYEFTLGGPFSVIPPHIKICTGDTAFLFVGTLPCEGICFSAETKHIYIFNLKNRDGLKIQLSGLANSTRKIVEYDCFMNACREDELPCDETLALSSEVGIGCMVHIYSAF